MKKYFLELGGTFLLTLIVALSLTHIFVVPTAILAGLVLMFAAYTIGSTTGAHINPAITLGFLSVRKISFIDAIGYIIAQVAGALLALVVVQYGTHAVPVIAVDMTSAVFFAEMLGALFFGFGIASIVYERVHTMFDGLVAGLSLFLGIAIASMIGSNGVLNPAVALGIHSVNVLYIVAPIVGVVIGFWIVKIMHERSLV